MVTGKRTLFLLPLLLFFFLVAPELVERSMYTDGVAYAAIAKNLAHDIGSLWSLKLSDYRYPVFAEHPPLVFGIQSLFFKVLGDRLVTERVYALTIFLLSAGLLVVLWRDALRDHPRMRRLWFTPLTLWLANEVVYHFYPANVLEPTLTVFTLAAVWAGLRAVRGAGLSVIAWTVLVGLLVALANLCKGFVALFPLGLFVLHWLVFRRGTLVRALALTALLTVTVVGFYAVLWQFDAPRASLLRYLDTQVLASLNSSRSGMDRHYRDSHWYIVRRTFEVLIPALLLTAWIAWAGYRKFGRRLLRGESLRYGILYLLLGAAASFPLAISPKQSFYYLLPSMAYYALGLGLVISPVVAEYFAVPWRPRVARWVGYVGLVLLVGAVGNTLRHVGQVTRRDRVLLGDVEAMHAVLPVGTTIGAQGEVAEIVSYLYRTREVTVDTTRAHRFRYDFVVAPATERLALDTVGVGMLRYRLYRVGSRRR